MVNEYLHQWKGLPEYVVIACCRKMVNRLEDSLSKPYLQFLEDIASTSTFPQFETITFESSKPSPIHSSNDRRFLEILPKLESILNIKVPQLLQALSDPATRDKPIAVYNEDTYEEYHRLLWELLNKFKCSLKALKIVKDAHTKEFDETVMCIVLLGNALQTMAGGAIIEVHLKVITMAFNKPRHVMLDTNQEMEYDEELYQISSTLPMWQAYREWLKLMVVHFDAVHILIAHMQTIRNSNITIKVITTPHPDQSLLSWKTLLRNERYFDEGLFDNPTTCEIIAFIEKWQGQQSTGYPNVRNVIENLKRKLKEGLDSKSVDDIIKMMKTMKACESPGFEDTVEELISDMESLKGDGLAPTNLKLVNEIIIKLGSLRDRAAFFTVLKDLRFTGSIHSEVSLACFMMERHGSKLPEEYKHIFDELSVS